jgi:integrase
MKIDFAPRSRTRPPNVSVETTNVLSCASSRSTREPPIAIAREPRSLSTRTSHPLPSAPLFKPLRNNRRGTTDTALTADGVYQILKFYGKTVGISVNRFGPHAARVTAATNALDQGADIVKVQAWLDHSNVSTTRVYDHRKTRPDDSPVFKVGY